MEWMKAAMITVHAARMLTFLSTQSWLRSQGLMIPSLEFINIYRSARHSNQTCDSGSKALANPLEADRERTRGPLSDLRSLFERDGTLLAAGAPIAEPPGVGAVFAAVVARRHLARAPWLGRHEPEWIDVA